MSKGRYTHGGPGRTGNSRAGAGSISGYTKGHRKPIIGHGMRPVKVHGMGTAR